MDHKTITFDTSELDLDFWKSRALQEANQIFANPNTRNGRSIDEVIETCMVGQAAEVWLISKGFKNDPRPYRDVVHPDGTPIEVKVSEWPPRWILNRYVEKIRMFSNSPTTVYLFHNVPRQSLYTFVGIFKWNGSNFIGYRPEL